MSKEIRQTIASDRCVQTHDDYSVNNETGYYFRLAEEFWVIIEDLLFLYKGVSLCVFMCLSVCARARVDNEIIVVKAKEQ